MFEVTSDHIAALNDRDLRALIGLLAEAEMRQRDLPASAVTWGGNQTAKDGGLDVHVALPYGTPVEGFVPRAETGYQVKTPDMPRKEILKEMKPNDVIRPVLQDLAKAGGAYIIVSSTASTSKSALDSRKMAMREAVFGMPNADKLTLDFFDCSRVATWVRGHAGMIAWVREKIGRAYPHWRPFGAWTVLPPGADPAYLGDDTIRIKTGDKDEGAGSTAAVGIDKIRDRLRSPGHVVRLVGLSGVGKTRLAEALFDANVGTNSLDSALAIYTNVADGPEPSPRGLASDLIAARKRAILVIDNCTPETHRQLSEIVRTAGSTVSVITVEYDIREDRPEGTDVFSLETSSLPLIENLVRNRFKNISQVDAQTIAGYSGGNARIALTLAATLKKNETVAGLAEAELFERLFEQRHGHNPGLLAIAQACSLVYSFDGENLSGDGAELPVLGGLVGRSASDVFAAVADLKARDLLQTRGPWRAVLPHAIANRMAVDGLQRIPPATIKMSLVDGGSDRLRQSFSRRLGYLNGSKEACAIVDAWLAPGGLLGDLSNLNEIQRSMLANVAPIAPDHVLTSLENALARGGHNLKRMAPFIGLLRSIAYDATTFDRAAAAIVELARKSSASNNSSDPANVFVSLFTIVLSGTRAPAVQRLRLIEALLQSSDSGKRGIGIRALGAMLKTGNFTSTYSFDFGARSRDYGYHPVTGQDVCDWFEAVLTVAEKFAFDGPCAEEVRNEIAREFRGLWAHSGRRDDVNRITHAIGAKQFWREGWVGARNTQRWEGKTLPEDSQKQLDALELFLRPKDLISRISGVVIGPPGGSRIDLGDFDEVDNGDYASALARANSTAEMLGRDLADAPEDFETLLPKLVSSGGRVADLGKGIALAAEEPRQLWLRMMAGVASNAKPNVSMLSGFLEGLQKRDPALTGELLDDAIENSTLAQHFPLLQLAVGLDESGLVRLHRALQIGKAPIGQFYNLAGGRACDAVPAQAFKQLLLAIADKPDGLSVAIDILSMRLHSDSSDKRRPMPEVAQIGRELLRRYVFHRKANRIGHEDYELGVIAAASLEGEEGAPVAQRLVRGLLKATGKPEMAGHDFNDLMKGMFETQPVATLEALFEGDKKEKSDSIRLMQDFLAFGKSPIEGVPDQLIIDWCNRDPTARYPFLAAITVLFRRPDDKSLHAWTSLARRLLAEAPNAAAVFEQVVSRLYPTSWSGSLATKLESRLALLNQIDVGQNATLAEAITKAKRLFEKRVVDERKHETDEDRSQSGRFE
jgi:hypothetical protein